MRNETEYMEILGRVSHIPGVIEMALSNVAHEVFAYHLL